MSVFIQMTVDRTPLTCKMINNDGIEGRVDETRTRDREEYPLKLIL